MLDISLRYTIWSGITTKKKNHITLVNFLFNFEDEGWELLVFFFFFEKQILLFFFFFFDKTNIVSFLRYSQLSTVNSNAQLIST